MTDYHKPIPKLEFPNHDVAYDIVDEPLVPLATLDTNRIVFEPRYKLLGIEGAVCDCSLRTGVAERLLKAVRMLPRGYGFKIFDAWRPFKVQQELYRRYRESVMADNPGSTPEEIDRMTDRYVSIPRRDQIKAPVHTTGGAVDLTVIRLEDGEELNMGTDFDCFGEEANTAYFEDGHGDRNQEELAANRRLLYNVMIEAGFTNLPSEWWHYDYGNAYWAYNTGHSAKYGGIFE